ncbi:ATP-binding protein [Bradyrhizobium cenepequi]|uniref:ATP-binding protein n=1 Tax=Bradyrhizobium cenepequi TaxID=2821403 RepID=UPI001CE3A1D9|nr:ATP-binding protein [Bradyrhizobium cenepequi]MCA6111541.1 hypothetical protein [Bradyrhizobium cenepequi]
MLGPIGPGKSWLDCAPGNGACRDGISESICGAHLGVSAPDTTRMKTRESDLSAKTAKTFSTLS